MDSLLLVLFSLGAEHGTGRAFPPWEDAQLSSRVFEACAAGKSAPGLRGVSEPDPRFSSRHPDRVPVLVGAQVKS